ncbi:hypothetical protein LOK49_LG14G00149 [Camellia lanceoleosa]|uniref:Uncharacterized protein n=1 Tax=Camellia lanceoleosa TaxID=1840588 RepID=A0ACC0FE25_9ERIC|nr:hypothetical protein LOK49_LG14G00149 [Camellia lanceoleosa]
MNLSMRLQFPFSLELLHVNFLPNIGSSTPSSLSMNSLKSCIPTLLLEQPTLSLKHLISLKSPPMHHGLGNRGLILTIKSHNSLLLTTSLGA